MEFHKAGKEFFYLPKKGFSEAIQKKMDIFSNFPYLNLNFDEESINFREIEDDKGDLDYITSCKLALFKRKYGDESLK